MSKARLSATVDADVLEAGREAVASGRADNLSEWVNGALHSQVDHDRRLLALEEFLQDYEAEHGVISHAEIEAAERRARDRAVVVRGGTKRTRPSSTRSSSRERQ